MDRISRIRIENLRCFAEEVTIDLEGLTVLIGENGTGKSTVVEACELLRRMSTDRFMDEFNQVHRGVPSLLRRDALNLLIGLELTASDNPPLDYQVTIAADGRIVAEYLRSMSEPQTWIIHRGPTDVSYADVLDRPTPSQGIRHDRLALTSWGDHPPHPAFTRVRQALANIEVQLPFDVTPLWANNATQRLGPGRLSTHLVRVDQLGLLGHNLPNAWHALTNNYSDAHRAETMELVRLGLGDHIDSVAVIPDVSGGSVALSLRLKGVRDPIPAVSLSDGMLAWLAFVALFRLERTSPRSLLVMDEVERHLHPRLLSKAMAMMKELAGKHPVLLTTHSDRLLDLLDDPAKEIVLAEPEPSRFGDPYDPSKGSQLRRPDAQRLQAWLENYSGYGSLRAEGYEALLYGDES